ncbi:MAG: sulfatase/phosphatase domain-containing protein, partial [Verrucomicrobiia bacterium]
MNHRAGFDRHQTLLLPESLDDHIVPEHPVRFLDAFVASLNLAALGFRHATVKAPDGRAAEGKVCRHPVAMLDLIPTLFALAGTPPPWPLHGHDLSPILKNPDAPWPHPVILEFFGHRFGDETDRALTGNDGLGGVPWWLSLRQGRHKYIRTLVKNEIEELYDLEADPEELTNLALVPEHR